MKDNVMMKYRLSVVLCMLVLSGCASLTRSEYHPPALQTPERWTYAGASAQSSSNNWWQDFGVADLDALVDQVLTRNNDLVAAGIKLHRARLEAGLAADQMMPTLGAQLSASRSRTLSAPERTTRSYGSTVSLSWEADLWGRLASARDAAQWEARASEEDLQNTALSLVGATAKLYWQKAYLNQRIELAQQSIRYTERVLDLAQKKYAAGAVSSLDVFEAQQSLVSQQASLSQLQQQRVEADSSLAILLDGPPGPSFVDPARLPDQDVPQVDADLPANLLARRPDLHAAELRLRSTLATGDATRLAYYPSLSLTGSLGTSSSALHDILQNPVGTVAAQLSLPFLQWNEMQLKVKVAKDDYDLAVVNFRQTLYSAFADVENALSARARYAEQAVLLQQSLQAAQASEQRYEIRYRAGAATLKDWLDAQEKRRNAEVSLAENQLNRFNNHVTLMLALGGNTSHAPQP